MIGVMAHTGTAILDPQPADPVAGVSGRQPAPRSARFAAAASDGLRLAAGSLATLLVAIAFLLWRTSWGAVDASLVDSSIAAALILSPAPTWIAWLLSSVIEDAATPGQRRRDIAVGFQAAPWPGARLLRFAVHPLSVPGWLWLAAIAYLLDLPPLTAILSFVTVAVALTAVGSAILLAAGRRPLHDLLLRTEVEAKS